MTSRERVRAVLAHKIPDRMPNGLGGCETAGMHVLTYDKLQRILNCEAKPPRVDTFMVNAVFEEDVISKMDGDVILLDSPLLCKSRLRGNVEDQWKPQRLWGKQFSVPVKESFSELEDGTINWESRRIVCPKGAYYFDKPHPTNLNAELIIPDPDTINPREVINEETLLHMEKEAKRLYEETDLSICVGETIHDLNRNPGGIINTMMLMLEEPDALHEILDKYVDAALKQLRLIDQAVGKYVDFMAIAHDFGDNRGVTIGDDLWREIYKPHYKRLFEGWHSITNMKVNFHSCGSISSILDDIIECGVDIINPVQTSAADMSAEFLKEKFGDRIIFFGGAYDAQLFKENMTYEEVYSKVYRKLKILGNGGNYIFSGTHNLPAEMPEHHVKAMMDAYFDARAY